MTLYKYLPYLAVTSLTLIAIGFLILIFKSWMDRLTFRANTDYAVIMNQAVMQEQLKTMGLDDFDAHVASAPGITHEFN